MAAFDMIKRLLLCTLSLLTRMMVVIRSTRLWTTFTKLITVSQRVTGITK